MSGKERLNKFPRELLKQKVGRHIGATNENGCQLWTGVIATNGYGRVTVKNMQYPAHRAVYVATFGPVPEDMCVCHKCDVRSCVNPDHLFVGSHSDNMFDAAKKGRLNIQQNPRKGERHGMARLTEKQVVDIRTSKKTSVWWAKQLGMNIDHIRDIRKGRSWKHLSAIEAAIEKEGK